MGMAALFDQWKYQEQAAQADQIAADLRSQEPVYLPPVSPQSPLEPVVNPLDPTGGGGGGLPPTGGTAPPPVYYPPLGGGETATGGVANPYGGFMPPTRTYTPHTGTTGEGEFKQGTGGGQEIIRPPLPNYERILARPDLQRARRPKQLPLGAPIGRVTPMTNQNPLSSALREGGQ